MSNAIKTIEKSGNCPTLKDKRPSTIKAYFIKGFSPIKHVDDYIKLLKNGAVSQSSYTMVFNCVGCNLCKPLRLDTQKFRTSKHQKRILNVNKKLTFHVTDISINNDYFKLYQKYIMAKHPNSPMNGISYEDFKTRINFSTHLGVIKDDDVIVGFSALKKNKDSISYEYAIYNPDMPKQSLGTFLSLKLIEYARAHDIKHIYMGEINLESQNLNHKAQYEGSEVFNKATKEWIPIKRNPTNLDHIP